MTDWNRRFMDLAEHIAGWSKDRSTKLGCVIVGPLNEIRSVGYNGMARGVDDNVEARHKRPEKYRWFEHAERNAIFNAARVGIPLYDTRLYIPWYPCSACANAIVQSGIAWVFAYYPDWNDAQWGEEFAAARTIMDEGSVEVRFLSGSVNRVGD